MLTTAAENPDLDTPLTQASSIRALPPEQARLGRPARITGVVTYSNPGKSLLFICDETGSIYVSPQNQPWDLPAGQRVEATGVISQGGHLPYLNRAVFRDLGAAPLPEAKPISFAQLAVNTDDGNWVEITGVARKLNVKGGHASLEIAAEGRRLNALVLDATSNREFLGSLVDSEVRVKGVAGLADKDPKNPIFIDLHVPNMQCVSVQVKSPVQPLSIPLQTVRQIAAPSGELWHRVHVRGTLRAVADGIWHLADATGEIRLHSDQALPSLENQVVDVVGFPTRQPGQTGLEDITLFLPAQPQNPLDTGVEPKRLPLLTQIEDVRNLPPMDAQLGYPVFIDGVITYADSDWNLVFVQDETSGILVNDAARKFTGSPGQLATISGYSTLGTYAPIIRNPEFIFHGPGRMPTAKAVTLDDLRSGREDAQRCELNGVVRYVNVAQNHLQVSLSTFSGPVNIFIPHWGTNAAPADWVDAEMQWRGVCEMSANPASQRVEFRLYAANLSDLRMLKPAPADPFALPPQAINQLLQYQPEGDSRHRTLVRGTVLFRDPKWLTLFVQEGDSSLYVVCISPPEVKVGDEVVAVGFITQDSYGLAMKEAITRRIGPSKPINPLKISIDDAISGKFQSRLVTFEANLVDRLHGTRGRGLVLQSGPWSFTALLESTQDPELLEAIPATSRVQLTGICRIENSDDQNGKALSLQLRSAQDVSVLQRPPRWPAQYWMMATGLAALFLAAAAVWVLLLRQNVREQTAVIRRDLERQAALESEFRELFNHANDLIQTLHPDGRLAHVNPAWLKTLKYSANETSLLNFRHVIFPEDISLFERSMQQALTGELINCVSLRLRRKDGQVIMAEGSFAASFKAGQPALVRSIFRDVTERKLADDAVRAANRLLMNIIEFLPDATFVIDSDKKIIAWNHACETMTGVKKEVLLGQGNYAYAEPIYGFRRPILIDLLDEPNNTVEKDYQLLRRDGNLVCAESHVSRLRQGLGAHLWSVAAPLFDEQGIRCGAIEVIRDVTEQKRTERALVEKERKYRDLVEHANSIILRWNSEGQITFLNEFGLRFFGYSAEEIFGRQLVGTIVPFSESGGRDLTRLVQQIVNNPEAYEQNINENVKRNGERAWVTWANRIERDRQGQVVEILSVGTDITEQRRAEAAIRELNASLERRVAERTAELAVARDRAEEADRLKSAFLATMSHELRTPLNSIIGFTGILLQELAGPLNPEQSKQLEMVRNSARHLLALINDVLDISKIEAGQLEVTRELFALRASVERAAQIVQPLADKKGLALRLNLASDLGSITSDRRRFEQVLINLLNNAIKFTDRGAITLETARLNPEKIEVRVRDTGIGLKPENLASLFQPFHQIDTGLSRQHEGTGLGLAICRRLVELMGGQIRVESQFGEGSTFSFTLPCPVNELATKDSTA